MNVNEIINQYQYGNFDDQTKSIRLLILNAKLKKDNIDKEINQLTNNFITLFDQSNSDYELERQLDHMLILLKGDILYSDFCKKHNFYNDEFTIEDLEKKIREEEFNTEYSFDEIRNTIKQYCILTMIDEKSKKLKEELLNVLNIIINEKYNENQLDLIQNRIFKLYKINVLDKITYSYSLDFINYIKSKVQLF